MRNDFRWNGTSELGGRQGTGVDDLGSSTLVGICHEWARRDVPLDLTYLLKPGCCVNSIIGVVQNAESNDRVYGN